MTINARDIQCVADHEGAGLYEFEDGGLCITVRSHDRETARERAEEWFREQRGACGSKGVALDAEGEQPGLF